MGLQEQTFTMLLLQAFSYIPGGKIMYYTLRRQIHVAKIVSSRKKGRLCTMKFKCIWMEALVVLRHSAGGTEKTTKISLSWLRACLLTSWGTQCRREYIISMNSMAFQTLLKVTNSSKHFYVLCISPAIQGLACYYSRSILNKTFQVVGRQDSCNRPNASSPFA
jgi:hypothetical protein